MGRAGVTLQEVEKAALQLQGRGKNPSVDAVREVIGTGSKSTIAQHLRDWKAQQSEPSGKLPQELLAVVTGLWERLSVKADQRIGSFQERCDQQQKLVTDFEEELANNRKRLVEMEKELAILADQKSFLQKNLSQMEDKVETLRHEKIFLIQEKSELQGHLKHLERGTQYHETLSI